MNRSQGPILALTASTKIVSVALHTDARTFTDSVGAGRGCPDAAFLAARLVESAGSTAAALAAIVVDRGPGSYTGLRVALTFARTIAAFRPIPLHALTSVELIAAAAWRSGDAEASRDLLVILDARRGHDHVARLRTVDGSIVVVDAPRAVRSESSAELIDGSADVVAESSVSARVEARCRDRGAGLLAPRPLDAGSMFAPELRPMHIDPDQLEPLYLLPSYAEDPAGT